MELTGNFFYFFLLTILGCTCFSISFFFLLSTRLLRRIVGDKAELIWITLFIVVVSITLIINLEAFIIIFIDRVLSGRLFWLNIFFGTVLILWSIIKVSEQCVEPSDRIKALLSIQPFTNFGLVVGNILLIICNGLCCFIKVPSLL
jgi:hypothetical protein